jgi:hypothetical protein|tara:strand:- start:175 stop:1386 length:1212 start_codon:yes stop_codon:yes gene_type:complete
MALPSSGNPISFGDINDELGENTTDTLDMLTAAQKFTGILDDNVVSMDEFHGLTFAGGSGTYGTRNSHTFRFVLDQDGTKRGFADGELVDAAENGSTGLANSEAVAGQSDFVDDFVNNSLTNGDTVFAAASGDTKTNLRPGGDFASGTHFMLDTTADEIFQIDSNGDVSNVRNRTPGTPTISLTSKNSNSITISIVSDTVVTRQLAPFLDGTELTNILPSASGSIGNTSVTTSYTYSGLDGDTSYALKVRGERAGANGSDSNTLNVTTDVAVTWTNATSSITMASSLGNDLQQDILLANGHAGGPYAIELSQGDGGTSVSCAQPGAGTLELRYADNSSMTGASSFATSHSGLSDVTTKWYYQLRYTEQGTNTNHTSTNNRITWTNSGASDNTTGVNITFSNSL